MFPYDQSTFHQLVVSYHPANKKLRWFVDGQFQDAQEYTIGDWPVNTSEWLFEIGCIKDGGPYELNMLFDDTGIYSRPWSDYEAKLDYNYNSITERAQGRSYEAKEVGIPGIGQGIVVDAIDKSIYVAGYGSVGENPTAPILIKYSPSGDEVATWGTAGIVVESGTIEPEVKVALDKDNYPYLAFCPSHANVTVIKYHKDTGVKLCERSIVVNPNATHQLDRFVPYYVHSSPPSVNEEWGVAAGGSIGVDDFYVVKFDHDCNVLPRLIPVAEITQQPESHYVRTDNNESVTFSVTASGNATYQWKHNGIPIQGATAATYTKTILSDADLGSYTVTVTYNQYTIIQSDPAILTKYDPNTPFTVSTQPQSQTVSGGSPVTFTVAATGDDIGSYQWKHNGTAIDGATGATLTIPAAWYLDVGTYSVVVTSRHGGTQIESAAATLTIDLPIVRVSGAEWIQMYENGGEATVTVTRTGPVNEPLEVVIDSHITPNEIWERLGQNYNITCSSGPVTYGTGSGWTLGWANYDDQCTFTIPAGQSSVTLTVHYVGDNFVEGWRTIWLFVVPDLHYYRAQNHDGGLKQVTVLDNSPVPPCVTAPVGMVAWWPFEGDASDKTGNNNGTGENEPNYGYWAAVGNALQGSVTVPASTTLDVGSGQGFTIEGWIVPTTITGRHPIIEWTNGSTDYSVSFGLQVNDNKGYLYGSVYNPGAQAYFTVTAPVEIPTHTRTHVAMRLLSWGEIDLYVNGQMVEGLNSDEECHPQTYNGAVIGRGCVSDTFQGLIDELSVYNRLLSDTEIQVIYAAQGGGKCAYNKVGWWQGECNLSDSTVCPQNGQAVGDVTCDSGVRGDGLSFEGGYVTIPPNANCPSELDFSSANSTGFTIELFINPDNVNAYAPLVAWDDEDFGFGAHFCISQPLYSGQGPRCLFGRVNCSQYGYFLSSPPVLIQGVYQHVAMTYDKATGIARLYHRGYKVAEQNIGIVTPWTFGNVNLGFIPSANTVKYAGGMDEVGIYNRALTDDEIAIIANQW